MKNNFEKPINVIGGGLAGSECAHSLSKLGFNVRLFEMKPKRFSPAHISNGLAELVCSNSLKNASVTNACGLLKEEMRLFGSIVVESAYECRSPAGGALAVDREKFSEIITRKLEGDENIEIVREEVTEFLDGITVVATGPLTSSGLFDYIKSKTGDMLHFYDAAAPIVDGDSIDMDRAFFGDRYGKGDSDYLNCPMNEAEYELFYNELISAECVIMKEFEKAEIFDGCMPIEVMAKRGKDTMRFGPLKPVGLSKNGEKNYAVLQLRAENVEKKLFNLVGFQTNLKFGEQKRVFSLFPALKNAEFVRYGVMHRNTFLNAPKTLDKGCRLKSDPNVFFAGQITGVEGYVESAMSGMYAAYQLYHLKKTGELFALDRKTMTGAIIDYISTENKNFQPMNANFGIFDSSDIVIRTRNKIERYGAYAKAALENMKELAKKLQGV